MRYFGTSIDLGGLPLIHPLVAKGQTTGTTTGLPSRLPLPLGMHAVPLKASNLAPQIGGLGGLGGMGGLGGLGGGSGGCSGGGCGGGSGSGSNSLDLEGHIVSELATLEALGIHGDTDLGLLDSMMDSEQLLMMASS